MHKVTISNKDYYIEENSQDSLLISLQKQKAPVKYGCLIGVCGVCEFTIIEGKENIKYMENTDPLFPIDQDKIYPCCCKINGDIVLNK